MISGLIDACWHPSGMRFVSSFTGGIAPLNRPAICRHPYGMKRPVFLEMVLEAFLTVFQPVTCNL